MGDILTVHNLNKSFGSKHVLHDVDFTVGEGRIVGLIGPNGAGKSTIMKTILGLINYESGEIQVAGQTVTPSSHEALANVGALIEYPGLYPYLTGWDHLDLFANGDHQLIHIQRIISKLNMDDFIKRLARGYSVGMKQKLGVAMALVNEPSLVILDEPMNGLDPQSIKDLRDLIIEESQKGTSFLISSHILSELEKLAQDVLIIDKGKIVSSTTMHQLLVSQGRNTIFLQTSDDPKARDLLKTASFELDDGPQVRIIDRADDTLANALKTLINAGLDVNDMQREEGSLESSLMDLLAKDRVAD